MRSKVIRVKVAPKYLEDCEGEETDPDAKPAKASLIVTAKAATRFKGFLRRFKSKKQQTEPTVTSQEIATTDQDPSEPIVKRNPKLAAGLQDLYKTSPPATPPVDALTEKVKPRETESEEAERVLAELEAARVAKEKAAAPLDDVDDDDI